MAKQISLSPTAAAPLDAPAARTADAAAETPDVRQRILDTASALFYSRGVRAVGVDLVVAESGVAKTSLYRHFRTKDDLIVAFLAREDVEFWALWDDVAAKHAGDPAAELDAQMRWIAKRLARANYRGCPQINVAAEFAEYDHPSREVSRQHMQAMRQRLTVLARALGAARANDLAAQLGVLVNGAFVSASLLTPEEAPRVLLSAARALVAAARA
ncbi:MAG: TetR/AcrR family transcriptional regulator [Burkholderiales bacterium]|nr:TetR/AcrR family transcriptional regulator [Burkholderiales bacterium]